MATPSSYPTIAQNITYALQTIQHFLPDTKQLTNQERKLKNILEDFFIKSDWLIALQNNGSSSTYLVPKQIIPLNTSPPLNIENSRLVVSCAITIAILMDMNERLVKINKKDPQIRSQDQAESRQTCNNLAQIPHTLRPAQEALLQKLHEELKQGQIELQILRESQKQLERRQEQHDLQKQIEVLREQQNLMQHHPDSDQPTAEPTPSYSDLNLLHPQPKDNQLSKRIEQTLEAQTKQITHHYTQTLKTNFQLEKQKQQIEHISVGFQERCDKIGDQAQEKGKQIQQTIMSTQETLEQAGHRHQQQNTSSSELSDSINNKSLTPREEALSKMPNDVLNQESREQTDLPAQELPNPIANESLTPELDELEQRLDDFLSRNPFEQPASLPQESKITVKPPIFPLNLVQILFIYISKNFKILWGSERREKNNHTVF